MQAGESRVGGNLCIIWKADFVEQVQHLQGLFLHASFGQGGGHGADDRSFVDGVSRELLLVFYGADVICRTSKQEFADVGHIVRKGYEIVVI